MLTVHLGEPIEILQERAYPGVLTVCCLSQTTAMFIARDADTETEPIYVASQRLPWVVHVQAWWQNPFVDLVKARLIETVDTFTPPPVAWAIAYVSSWAVNRDGSYKTWLDFSWPDTLQEYLQELSEEEPIVDPKLIAALPLWYCPRFWQKGGIYESRRINNRN